MKEHYLVNVTPLYFVFVYINWCIEYKVSTILWLLQSQYNLSKLQVSLQMQFSLRAVLSYKKRIDTMKLFWEIESILSIFSKVKLMKFKDLLHLDLTLSIRWQCYQQRRILSLLKSDIHLWWNNKLSTWSCNFWNIYNAIFESWLKELAILSTLGIFLPS